MTDIGGNMNKTDSILKGTDPHHLGVWPRIALVLAMAASVLWIAGALWDLVALLTMSFSRQSTFTVQTGSASEDDWAYLGPNVTYLIPLESSLSVQNISEGAALLLGVVALLNGASWISLATLVFLVSLKIFRGRPFSGFISRALSATGLLMLVAVVLMAALGGAGKKQTMDQIGPERITSQPGLGYGDLPFYIWNSISLPLLIAGLLLLLLAGAFKLGTRYQQDTEGLV